MPTHLPFKPGDFKMSLDLDRIDEEDWFETDPSSDTNHQPFLTSINTDSGLSFEWLVILRGYQRQ